MSDRPTVIVHVCVVVANAKHGEGVDAEVHLQMPVPMSESDIGQAGCDAARAVAREFARRNPRLFHAGFNRIQ